MKIVFEQDIWTMSFALALLVHSFGVSANDSLDYTSRGNWSEGIKSAPVSGFDIALTSATARPVKACLSKTDGDFILAVRTQLSGILYPAVREEFPVYNYWLDRVKPSALAEGKLASEKVLRWSTKTVLARLQQFEPANLVTITRVGSSVPSANDQVAIGMICRDSETFPPLESYVFLFGVRSDSAITYKILDAAGKTIWQEQQDYKVGTLFRIRWRPDSSPHGRYVLHLTARPNSSAAVLNYKVTFDHLW